MKNYFEQYNVETGITRVVYKSCCKCSKPFVFAEIKNGITIYSKEFKLLREAMAATK